jgi:hypothetical protein
MLINSRKITWSLERTGYVTLEDREGVIFSRLSQNGSIFS